MDWVGWPLERLLLLMVSIMFLVVFIQVTLFHYRQNFRHWAMWAPVLLTPLGSIAALVLVFVPNQPWLVTALGILLAIGILAGLLGFYLHLRGVGERVGGYKLNNFLVGPPIMLPLTVFAISILGLLALHWRP